VRRRGSNGGGSNRIWENFFEKKFSQTLSKNFDWSLAVWARRETKALENLVILVEIVIMPGTARDKKFDAVEKSKH